MRIATWNVNGIRAREAQLLEWVAREQPDVVCLQEIKARPDQVPEDLASLAGYHRYWHGERAYSGVALLVRGEAFATAPTFRHPPFDHETRIVQAELGELVIASVYVPNGGKDYEAKLEFLRAMEGYVAEVVASGRSLLVCGDLNVTRSDRDVHPKERRVNAIGQRPDERALLERVLARGMVDLGRALDPDNDELFTWWPPWRNMRQRNIGWRLDYLLASEALGRRATACAVLAAVGTSDHAPVVACFSA